MSPSRRYLRARLRSSPSPSLPNTSHIPPRLPLSSPGLLRPSSARRRTAHSLYNPAICKRPYAALLSTFPRSISPSYRHYQSLGSVLPIIEGLRAVKREDRSLTYSQPTPPQPDQQPPTSPPHPRLPHRPQPMPATPPSCHPIATASHSHSPNAPHS